MLMLETISSFQNGASSSSHLSQFSAKKAFASSLKSAKMWERTPQNVLMVDLSSFFARACDERKRRRAKEVTSEARSKGKVFA